jgi:hypothetical protein
MLPNLLPHSFPLAAAAYQAENKHQVKKMTQPQLLFPPKGSFFTFTHIIIIKDAARQQGAGGGENL